MGACPWEWVIPQQTWMRRFESTQRKLGRKFSESLKLLLEPESRRQSTCPSAPFTCLNPLVKSVLWDHVLAPHPGLWTLSPLVQTTIPLNHSRILLCLASICFLKPHTRAIGPSPKHRHPPPTFSLLPAFAPRAGSRIPLPAVTSYRTSAELCNSVCLRSVKWGEGVMVIIPIRLEQYLTRGVVLRISSVDPHKAHGTVSGKESVLEEQ